MALIFTICHWTFIRFYSFFLLFVLFFTTGSSFHSVSPLFCRIQVTLIRNLESYGIEPQEFAHKIQIKAACSTAGNIGYIVLRLYLWSVRGYLVRQRGTVDFVTFIDWIIMIDSKALNCKECSVIVKVGCIIVLVTQLPGKNINPGMQILAQGNQVALVANFLLGKLSVMLSWLTTRLSLYHTAAGRFSQFRIMQWL